MRFSTSISVLALATKALGLSGEATFYGGNLAGGACSFSTYTLPVGIYGTALSDSNWNTAGNCGACISVTGPDGNSITAMIVDECPGCGLNHLDLFPDAFKALADPSKGVIPTTWEYVDCPITSPLEVHNKDGVSQWWFSMQVVNANKAVAKLEVSIDGGKNWQGTDRQSYNFFQKSTGFGTESVMVKVTSVDEDLVIVSDVKVASGVVAVAPINFISEEGPGSNPTTSAPSWQPPIQHSPTATPAVEHTSAISKSAATTSPSDPDAEAAAAAEATPQPGAIQPQSSSPAALPVVPASSTPPAADVFASPSPVAISDSRAAAGSTTTTISSTTTVYSTVTVHSPVSGSPPAKQILSTSKYPIAPAPAATTIVYNCGSGTSAAGTASSTVVIAVSPSPPGPRATVSLLPYAGAASRGCGISIVAAVAAMVAPFLI